eukprot:428676-Hanusia_phi.AAC.1
MIGLSVDLLIQLPKIFVARGSNGSVTFVIALRALLCMSGFPKQDSQPNPRRHSPRPESQTRLVPIKPGNAVLILATSLRVNH